MALAINRVTKAFGKVNLADVDEGVWFPLRRPDTEAMADINTLQAAQVPNKYWNLVDGPPKRVQEMTAEEKTVVDTAQLSSLKAQRIKQIDEKTEALIDQGFEHNGKVFSLSIGAQLNVLGLKNIIKEGRFVPGLPWNTKNDEDVYVFMTVADATVFYKTAEEVKTLRLISGTSLKSLVRAATTKAEVDAVVDDR
jgi:hypothetical protein